MTQAAPLTLDVRPTLRAGGEPFAQIMQAVASLEPGQALRLLATFEPVPLYDDGSHEHAKDESDNGVYVYEGDKRVKL